MGKKFWQNLIVFFAASMYLQVACASKQPAQTEKPMTKMTANLSSLREQVEAFAIGEGNEELYSKLAQRPRSDLISDLEKLRQQAPEEEAIQVKIAFLFCRLNHHYKNNEEMIARSLHRNSPYPGLPHDETIGFANDLIKRGNKQLLPVVLAAAEWADGALGEGIQDILFKVAMSDLDSILENLVRLSIPIRQGVYKQIKFALAVATDKDKAKLKSQLKSKLGNNDVSKVVQEMLQSID